MKGYEILDGAMLNSIIGEGTKFKGEFDLDGLLRIDGDFSGIIRSKGKVLVNGRAECDIYAGIVIIGGIVKGNVFSTEYVKILATGMVIGDITAPCLIIDEGVIFCGVCKICKTNELTKKNTQSDNEILKENISGRKDQTEKAANDKTDIKEELDDKENTKIYDNYLENRQVNNCIEEESTENIKKEENLYIENKY